MKTNKLEFLTRDFCKELASKSDVFYCTESIKEQYKVEIYNYRLASYNDFNDNNAFELRGITFVNYNGVWERFLSLEKFFNVNQCEAWSENILKTKKIQSVQNKEDGSLIQFIPFLIDGVESELKFYAKSKMTFDSDQAKMAQELFDCNENLRKLIQNSFKDRYTIIFELVSPKNQIVLSYDTTELRVLQIRNLDTGEYLKWDRESISFIESKGIKCAAQQELISIDVLLNLKTTMRAIEGWVITFEDGMKAKIKTDEYLALHGLFTNVTRENVLIEIILNDEIDDVIGRAQGEKLDFILEITEKVQHKFNHLVQEYKELRRKYFQDFEEDRKKFAMKHSKDKLFNGVMKELKTSFKDIEEIAEKRVKEYILKETSSLTAAQNWIKS